MRFFLVLFLLILSSSCISEDSLRASENQDSSSSQGVPDLLQKPISEFRSVVVELSDGSWAVDLVHESQVDKLIEIQAGWEAPGQPTINFVKVGSPVVGTITDSSGQSLESVGFIDYNILTVANITK